MAARDRYDVRLECPKCGNSGTAEASENDYPFMRSLDFRYDSLPDGFTVHQKSESRSETVLKCTCGEKFTA